MEIVFIEGYVNDRVQVVLKEVFGTDDVPIVGYMQEGGWWSQAAYRADRDLDGDGLRRIGLDVFEVEDELFGDNPVALALDAPGYKLVFNPPLLVFNEDMSDPDNSYNEEILVRAWVIGGTDDDIDDAYEE